MAQPVSAEDKIVPADWLRRPTPEMLRAVWPKAAMGKARADGKALISCKVSVQGTLFDCKVESESPPGLGFGSAAIAMAPQLLMNPATRNGQPFVSTVRIPVDFKIPGGGPVDSFGSRAVVRPNIAWKTAPTHAEVAAAYPGKAKAARIGGVAALECTLTEIGRLRSCKTMREEPRGQGFAAAAKDLAQRFQAFPIKDGDKRLDTAVVQLPVAFVPEMLEAKEPVVGKPNWAVLPTSEAISASLAKAPGAAGGGRVAIKCAVEQTGSLSGCSVVREEPSGVGLGAAALSLVDDFRLSTWSMEGLPVVGGVVTIPIRYEFGAAPAPPAKP